MMVCYGWKLKDGVELPWYDVVTPDSWWTAMGGVGTRPFEVITCGRYTIVAIRGLSVICHGDEPVSVCEETYKLNWVERKLRGILWQEGLIRLRNERPRHWLCNEQEII